MVQPASSTPFVPQHPHTVFVSHAHADNALCDRYVAALRARGLDVWYDRTNIQDGRLLTEAIEAELHRRSALVVLVTPAALSSYWVRLEVGAFQSLVAKDPSRMLLPVRIAECEMPLLMMGIKWIDAVALGFDAAAAAAAAALGAPSAPQPAAAKNTSPADTQTAAAGANPSKNSGSGINDIFEQLFGSGAARRAQRGADLTHELTISFEEAVHGCQKEIEVPRWEPCPTCHGKGAKPGTPTPRCTACQGTGEIRRKQQSIFGEFVNVVVCDRCQGEGYVITTPCDRCQGQGRVRNARRVTVNIPAGVYDGIKVRVTSEGDLPRHGGTPGTLFVALTVKPHEYFKRQGTDILYELSITAAEAARGAQVKVPTIDGFVLLTIPPDTPNGRTFRLKGKGVPVVHSTTRGDELVTVKVV